MKRYRHKKKLNLNDVYPPSEPCACDICVSYCLRPGWWTVGEAKAAIESGYGARIMLEVAPEGGWGVLSPSFRGCEGFIASQEASDNGCNFLKENLCELFGTGFQPLECRYCHHDRTGTGLDCHSALEREWHSPEGQKLVEVWKKSRNIDVAY
jgi:hypothetical protein